MALLLSIASPSFAESPRSIVFGGGWGPEGTQASIELHVESLSRTLAPVEPLVLFAGPDAKTRSVQIRSKSHDVMGRLLGLVLDRRNGIDVEYRSTSIRRDGPATKRALLDALAQTRKAPGGTILFGVGHGSLVGEGDNKQSSLSLWGTKGALDFDVLVRALDDAPRSGALAFVLGQCHSGGFARISHRGGKSSAALSDPARCVLAAVPGDRAASGCTSDVMSPDARAFMALIADALASPAEADLNHDGRVALDEAFTHARIEDETVDVPVRSSELFIRDRLGKTTPRIKSLDIDRLMRTARVEEKAVLSALRPPGTKRVGDVERMFDALSAEIDKKNGAIDDIFAQIDDARGLVQDSLFDRWPELTNPYHASSRRLLGTETKSVTDFLEALPELGRLRKLDQSARAEEKHVEDLERRLARLERWLRAAENVAFEAALRKKKPALGRQLDQILACESLSPL